MQMASNHYHFLTHSRLQASVEDAFQILEAVPRLRTLVASGLASH
jgi:hypothetical protein